MSQHLARNTISALSLRPALLSPVGQTLAADLRDLAAADPARERELAEARRHEMVAAFGLAPAEQRKPFAFSEGKALIPIHGLLINRLNASWGFVTGYSFIRSQLAAALADPDVEQIILDVNSPGGTVSGCPETAAAIFQAREQKPVLAVVDANAYSAAYYLASAASKIAVTPSGGVGSIGVVATHISLEGALKEAGIEVTFIHAGKHKVDGNPYQNLSDETRAEIQREVDACYEDFVNAVAAHRGMEADAVKDTEARVFTAKEALDLGLVDAVQTPSEALAALAAQDDEELDMSTQKPDNKQEQQQPAPQQPDAQAVAAARKAERERMAGILGCDEAKGKGKLAQHLAANTELSVDEAKACLAAAAPEQPEQAEPRKKGGNYFANAMENTPNPNVGPDGKEGGEDDEEPKPGARGKAALDALFGPKRREAARH